MACCDVIQIQRQCFLHEEIKFDFVIACQAGVWSSARFIFPYEIVNHVLLEFFLEIHYIVWGVNDLAYPPSIFHVFYGAASFGLDIVIGSIISPQFHCDTYDAIAIIFENAGGYRRVNT